MKTLKYLFIVCCVVLAITLAGCKSSAGVIPPTTTDTNNEVSEKEIIRDTIIETVADSSYYYAYLECRDGKVVVKDPEPKEPADKPQGSKRGKYLKKPEVKIDNNKLRVDCYAEVQYLKAKLKDKVKQIKTTVTIKIPYSVPAQLTGWQVFQLYCGRLFLFLVLLLIGAAILRYKKIV